MAGQWLILMLEKRGVARPPQAGVVIAGGGIAALEAAIALREIAGDQVTTTMCAPRKDFVYRPFAVGEPYGAARAMRCDLEEIAERCGAIFRQARIERVEGDTQRVQTREGEWIDYDYLIVACGARLLAGVPGSVTFWGVAEDAQVQGLIQSLGRASMRRVAFAMPGGGTWALPLYELALLAGKELAKRGIGDVELVVVTPEESPLRVFGRVASERVEAVLAERGIELITGAMPIHFEDGQLTVSPHWREPVKADAVLSLPRIEGRRIDGVPHDLAGFTTVDELGRIRGMRNAYAAGDVTTFPVKQGGLATQQADLVAEAIAAEIGVGAEPRPLDPVLRGVLWTGAEPLYLSSHLAGGHGETSSADDVAPWVGGEEDKIVGRYLTPFLRSVAVSEAMRHTHSGGRAA